jgi:hypothetical protein
MATDPAVTPTGSDATPVPDTTLTDYVLLRKVDSPEFILRLATNDAEAAALEKMGPLLERLVNAVNVWRELGVVSAGDRPTAWENAKRDYAPDMPQEIGSQGHAQLVPTRFWRTITAVVEQPPPQLRTEGL